MIDSYFKMLNGYSPTFTSFNGGVYEMDLTRVAFKLNRPILPACEKIPQIHPPGCLYYFAALRPQGLRALTAAYTKWT
mgnify:CR=1 FL=1